ncbi:RTA1 like protein-domain-containing protein [Ilyonectria robusta]|uniref:RTA1 like protein-domain-containing protein n=1 Tax=Ilyonectria robusta TaxID=1079257 RepID=UPI001E8EC446|nr:RTA1 like protein-domain-containing protein [Ilyonectria robusta]KAH8664754.1 RTA1 like protein-domain-containing protein [Ilyonectria robusta]
MTDPIPGVEPTKGGYYLWRYLPNKGAAVLFLLLFLASFFYISWKIYKTKARFCNVFAVGCFFEVVGYGARASAHDKTGKIMTYAIQNMFILVAPTLFAASIYMTLGRIITSIQAEKYSMIRPSRLTKTFVTGDVLSFVIQGGSAGLMVIQKPGLAEWGERLVMIGLVVQVVMFALFGIVAVVFHRRMRSAPTVDSFDGLIPWEEALYMLYAVSALIMVRSLFRVVEFAQGQSGYSLTHEWTMYVFDSLLMFAVAVLFAWRFPSELKARGAIPI